MGETVSDAPLVLEDKAIGWRDGQDGVWEGLPAELYHKSKAVSRSWTDHMEPPALFKHYISTPHKETPWGFMGTFVHSSFLTPNKPLPLIEKQPEVIVGSDGKEYPWSGKDCSVIERKKWQKARDLAGIMVLKPADWDTVHGCVESLVSNRDTEMRELIRESFTKGRSELSCFALFNVNGFRVRLRCRPDFTADSVDWLQDVKTLQNNDQTRVSAFERVVDFYRRQPPFYLDVFNAATGENRKEWRYFGVSKEPPYLARVFRLRSDSNAIRLGREDYIRRVATYVDCCNSGEWTGWKAEIVDVDLPKYTTKALEAE